jgi:hypothetical protein
MKSRACRFLALLTLVAASLAASADDAALLAETRAVAAAMPPILMAELQREIASGGIASAISACRETAPQMARDASAKTGWQIRRVSLKNRNPNAVPDDWERATLIEFDKLVAQGSDAASLEKAAIVQQGEQRIYRYLKALPTQPLCLSCHGDPAQIAPEVKAALAALYPDDKATGYAPGMVRGAIAIKRPLD